MRQKRLDSELPRTVISPFTVTHVTLLCKGISNNTLLTYVVYLCMFYILKYSQCFDASVHYLCLHCINLKKSSGKKDISKEIRLVFNISM